MLQLPLLVLYCKDIDRSKEFYERLGLACVEEKHGKGPRHFSIQLEKLVLELYPASVAKPVDSVRLGFVIKNAKQLVKQFSQVQTYEFGERKVYVLLDPDGRKVEIVSETP